jgi:hypothetical protein
MEEQIDTSERIDIQGVTYLGKTNNAEHSLPKELTLDEPSIHLMDTSYFSIM